MKKTGWGKRISGFMAVLALCLFCLSGRAYAYGMIDTEAEASLTVVYQDGDRGIADAEFSLYRIGDVSETARYSLAGEFADYPVSLEDLDSSGWRALAHTLAGYVQRDQIMPDCTGVTDADGRFTFGGLRPGLFLVTGKTQERQDGTYTPEAFICSLPGLTESDTWQYDLQADVKYEYIPEPEPVTLQVVKIWKADDRDVRPGEIEVELLKDGTIADVQTLNADNNWRYTWTGLDPAADWTAVEKEVPDGYTVSADREGTTIIVTNSGSGTDGEDSGGRLPQTGVLWWPVPLLAALGLILFAAGRIRRNRADDTEDRAEK